MRVPARLPSSPSGQCGITPVQCGHMTTVCTDQPQQSVLQTSSIACILAARTWGSAELWEFWPRDHCQSPKARKCALPEHRCRALLSHLNRGDLLPRVLLPQPWRCGCSCGPPRRRCGSRAGAGGGGGRGGQFDCAVAGHGGVVLPPPQWNRPLLIRDVRGSSLVGVLLCQEKE